MKTQLQIEGMSCEHCVRSVKEALLKIAGVKGAEVNLKGKSAAVEHDETVSVAALKAAVTEAGFETV